MRIEKLKWDSEFFGYDVGKISVTSGDFFENAIISTKDFKLIYVISDVPIYRKELNKCYVKITFTKQVNDNKISKKKSDLLLVKYTGNVNTQLLKLTYQSGVYSRFRLDNNFTNNEFEKLYGKWIENSLNGRIADTVEVIKDEASKILGFVTINFEGNSSKIGLLSVADKARGMGLGTLLLDRVNQLSNREGCKNIFVSTQESNNTACKFYEKNGFKSFEKKYIYHLWMD